jgi:hypothetical protein
VTGDAGNPSRNRITVFKARHQPKGVDTLPCPAFSALDSRFVWIVSVETGNEVGGWSVCNN